MGDKVLISITKSAAVAIREGDVLLRFGGEEFLCILPGANKRDAKRIAERIRVMVMESSVKNGDQEVKVTIRMGITTFPHNDIANQEEFIKLADEAMYTAKESGKNCIIAY